MCRYLIVPKTAELPYFDEAFKNYGYNKVEWVADLRYAGYRFYVFGPGFGVDVAHPRWEKREYASVEESTRRRS